MVTGGPPKAPPPERDEPNPASGAGATAGEFIPSALGQLSPAELEEERARAMQFNASFDNLAAAPKSYAAPDEPPPPLPPPAASPSPAGELAHAAAETAPQSPWTSWLDTAKVKAEALLGSTGHTVTTPA